MWRAAIEKPAGPDLDWNDAYDDAFFRRLSLPRLNILQDCNLRIRALTPEETACNEREKSVACQTVEQ